jgi:PAS domain S-box-containing protein
MDDAVRILGLESVEAREVFWRGVFDIHLDPLALLDVNYRIVRVNHALATALGCREDDLVGKRCYEVFHASSCPVQNCPHTRLLSDGCAHAEELDIRSLGGVFWISVTPVFNTEGDLVGSLHIARDVSRYKALEADLRVARDAMAARAEARARELGLHVRFEQLLVSLALDFGLAKSDAELKRLIQSGVAEIAAAGGYDRCVFWMMNGKSARVAARYERAGAPLEALADSVTDASAAWLFAAVDRMGLDNQFADGHKRSVVALSPPQEGVEGVALQAEYRPAEQKGTLPATPERLRLFCQIFANALWRHKDMAEMQRMKNELTRLDRIARMGQLTAMLAHELNQPLAATLCNAQAAVRLLAQTPPDVKEVRLALDDIVDNAHRAGEVVKTTRELFKGGRPSAHKVDVHSLVDRVLTLLHNEMALAGVVVEQSVSVFVPPVWGDEIQLQQVLLNLLNNALDAVREQPKGQRLISVCAEVDDASAGMLRLSVKDSGVGLLPGQEKLAFKPFHTTKQDGMGMGLAICKQIVDSFGGSIRVERVPEGGTVFHVILLLAGDLGNAPASE